jgi:TonB family protein
MARFAAAAVLLFAASAHAQAAHTRLDRDALLKQGMSLLRSGQFMRAYVIDERMIDDVVKRYGGDDPKLFATALVQKAAALTGFGREADARWYWDYALFIDPPIETDADVVVLGRSIEILKQPPPPIATQVRRVLGDVKAPKLIRRVEPLYPEGARMHRISGAVIVECVIDAKGIVRQGRVLKGLPAPTFGYTALEALRQWEFEPATLDGKPIAVIFNVTVNFKLVAGDD